MTTPDLITRLRGWPNLPGLNLDKDLMHEAADELERLRAQVAALKLAVRREPTEMIYRHRVLDLISESCGPAAPAQQAEPQSSNPSSLHNAADELTAQQAGLCRRHEACECAPEAMAGCVSWRAAAPSLTVGEREAFEAWCFDRRLMEQSHGIVSVSSHCETAWEAWQARAFLAPGAQAEPLTWRPIETAPKDGRDLLLWESGSYVPFVGAWRDGRRPGWHCDTEHYDTDSNACVVSNLWQGGVTHWMPLPGAPGSNPPAQGR